MPVVNENHARLCASLEWAEHIQTEILPRVTASACLGEQLLELGPGPGAATDWLRARVRRLVAIETDADAVAALRARFAQTNVAVVHGDAGDLPFASSSFDSAACFTMLHHVATVQQQNHLLAEVLRVLRPGGALVGSDSLPSDDLHHFHAGDTYNPIEPAAFLTRLQTLGYRDIVLSVGKGLTFVAHKASADAARGSRTSRDAEQAREAVPEARLQDGIPQTAGWFVVNARDAHWLYNEMRGVCRFSGQGQAHFNDLGVSLYQLKPGQPMALYHHEAGQEDFLVLHGRCCLIVEGHEREIKAWDFVHCPPETAHTIVGAGTTPALVLAVGARKQKGSARYPVAEAAIRHHAGVTENSTSAVQVYASFGEPRRGPAPHILSSQP